MNMIYKKAWRDIADFSGRAIALLIALSVGIFTVGTMLGAYSIVSREITTNYVETNPASATLDLDAVTPAVLQTARNFKGITIAEARGVVEARAKVDDQWVRMLLFVVDDFDRMRLNTFQRDSGAWPPPTGTMLIERQAAPFLGTALDGSVTVKTPNGTPQQVPVSGIVHDTTLAPAWQEQTGYGYVTLATLASLGEQPLLDELRIQVESDANDRPAIDAKALALAEALRAKGTAVHDIKVPPPGEHPHYGQMVTSLRLFLFFSSLGLVLSAILAAAVLSAMISRQVRDIGVMKAIGARNEQIARIYALLLLSLGGASLALGLPLAILAARRLSVAMADTMNFTVTNTTIPTWVYLILGAAGLILPLLVSWPTILRASRITVREALGPVGIGQTFGTKPFDRAVAAFGGAALPYLIAIRNMVRSRGRLILELAILMTAGCVFMTALNVRDGWTAMADRILTDRTYDADFLLSKMIPADRIERALSSVQGLQAVEIWTSSPTAVRHEGDIDIMRTYPDRGHGSLTLLGVPPQTKMVRFPVTSGRWLAEGDTDAIVLTPKLVTEIPGVKVGDHVTLSLDGKPVSWSVVGIALEVGGGASAYVSKAGFDKASGTADLGNDIRLTSIGRSAEERSRLADAVEQALAAAGIGVERSLPLDRLHAIMIGHVKVPIMMLVAASILLAIIGGLGLAAMTTISVLERTRELGIMKAIGAVPSVILKIVAGEGVLIAVVSWPLAILLSLPVTRVLDQLAGGLFGAPLPFTLSIFAAALWLIVIVTISIAATTLPAQRAARLVIREALVHE